MDNSQINEKITSHDLTKLYNDIKKYISDTGVSMLNKNGKCKEISEFDTLILKYVPTHMTTLDNSENN